MIETRSLAKRFGDTAALSGVSFRVEDGEIVGFLGPNGAGKTTALRILATYLSADSGSATLAGIDVDRSPVEAKRQLGYLPEQPPLYLDHTVTEYLRFCVALREVPRARRREAIDRVIDMCDLGSVRGRLIGNLSKGFRQRVGLAQALVHSPKVLLLDEPTVGLDPHQILSMRTLIRSFAGVHTVLLSSHILPEVAMTCSRVVIVHRGRVASEGSVESYAAQGGLEAAFLRATASELEALAQPAESPA